MSESDKKNLSNKKISKVTTFSVPFALTEIKQNISLTTTTNNNNIDAKTSKEEIINQAFQFHSSGNLHKAQIYYENFINQGFKDERVFCNYGIILKSIGQLKESELYTQKAIELNPNYAEAHYNLANTLVELGKLKAAELSFRKSLKLKPKFFMAHFNLALILIKLGNSDDAELSLLKAIELEPNLTCAVEELARRLFLKGKYDQAIEYLQKNISDSCQTLYLSCLLCLDKQKEFDQKFKELSSKKICNADMSEIIEHANVIYETSNYSHFCNQAINYVLLEKINEKLFSKKNLDELISFIKTDQLQTRSQSLIHNATQSTGNLFLLEYPFIQALKKALEVKIENYKMTFQNSEQGFIKNWPTEYTLRSWILCMRNGGFIEPHNHRYGWITGSFYLQVPKTNTNDGGNISFSYQGPKYPTKGKNFSSTIKKVETRDICIFPSSLFHHTIPFESEEERICLVFDLAKKNRN